MLESMFEAFTGAAPPPPPSPPVKKAPGEDVVVTPGVARSSLPTPYSTPSLGALLIWCAMCGAGRLTPPLAALAAQVVIGGKEYVIRQPEKPADPAAPADAPGARGATGKQQGGGGMGGGAGLSAADLVAANAAAGRADASTFGGARSSATHPVHSPHRALSARCAADSLCTVCSTGAERGRCGGLPEAGGRAAHKMHAHTVHLPLGALLIPCTMCGAGGRRRRRRRACGRCRQRRRGRRRRRGGSR